jgi:uncharacterized protein
MTEARPPFAPFDLDSALAKVQAAEDAWNTRDPHQVALAYTEDSAWRNRDVVLTGRDKIVEFLTAKWEREHDYVLRKSLWGFRGNRMAVRFQYEWHNTEGQWFRSYGNELWEFADIGLMRRREAGINDLPINRADRRYFGPRAVAERGPDTTFRSTEPARPGPVTGPASTTPLGVNCHDCQLPHPRRGRNPGVLPRGR